MLYRGPHARTEMSGTHAQRGYVAMRDDSSSSSHGDIIAMVLGDDTLLAKQQPKQHKKRFTGAQLMR